MPVQFTDQSTGSIDTWEWDFDNNGTIDSYDQSPAPWTYTQAGDYTVSLTVTGPGGSDTETKTDYIHVSEPSAPVIEKIRNRKCYPGKRIGIVGSGFGDGSGDSFVHIHNVVIDSNHPRIRLWTDTYIIVKIWFKAKPCSWYIHGDGEYRRRKVWVTVGGVDSNIQQIGVLKPDTCP